MNDDFRIDWPELIAFILVYILCGLMTGLTIYSHIKQLNETWVHICWILIAIAYPTYCHIIKKYYEL